MKYSKEALSIDKQIELLQKRELSIGCLIRAEKYLQNVSYYRLSGYMFHLQTKTGDTKFLAGTTFEDIINLYTFDKNLRRIFLEYLERIEVSFRTKIINTYSNQYGFYWYNNDSYFLNKNELRDEKEEILGYQNYVLDSIRVSLKDPKEQFLRAFKLKYTSEILPPENMSFEVLSFGKLIKLYTCLKNDEYKNSIAKNFKLPNGKSLVNWLLFLNDVRNVCAHHSRLWNRKFTANKLSFPSRDKHKIMGNIPEKANSNVYGAIIAINHLLNTFNISNSFTDKIEALVKTHQIKVSNLGFPEDWEKRAPWKIEYLS
ncbi:Abi family protein [Sphingobacterium sp. IITKGP-BTPF85]|uniref:Abi family protein n=1 Tax=Sphingobacterium sp. IITKGP-BTPF85 TaxID=1338009 RepID=UPI000389ED2C|nr:Abi family protein [Sphingobacterium sp. IITKGP-BTPF85]KKX47446.1 hypothetical protein L950_0226400 [Sphingobacterium sp. IITKGP-BTPF85]